MSAAACRMDCSRCWDLRDAQGQVPLVPQICVAFGEVYVKMNISPSLFCGKVCPGLPRERCGEVLVETKSRLPEQFFQCRVCLCQPSESLIIRTAVIFIFNYEVALCFRGQK